MGRHRLHGKRVIPCLDPVEAAIFFAWKTAQCCGGDDPTRGLFGVSIQRLASLLGATVAKPEMYRR